VNNVPPIGSRCAIIPEPLAAPGSGHWPDKPRDVTVVGWATVDKSLVAWHENEVQTLAVVTPDDDRISMILVHPDNLTETTCSNCQRISEKAES
jgi:hypothetical protein